MSATTTPEAAHDEITLGSVARRSGYSYRHIRRLVADGAIVAFNVSEGARPRWRVSEAELDRFLADRQVTR